MLPPTVPRIGLNATKFKSLLGNNTKYALGFFAWLVYLPAGVLLSPSLAGAITSPASMLPLANSPLPSIFEG